MRLFRLHAYSVAPQRTADAQAEPVGGALTPSAELRQVIDENVKSARFERRTGVDFVFDDQRTNSVRELLLSFAFDPPASARSAGLTLAARLADAMDKRSAPCLFISAASKQGSRRRVTLWTFPRDQALQFRDGTGGPSISVVRNVFSRSSHLRKAALFEGRRIRTEYLGGRVLDLQAGNTMREVADFWIKRFLTCQFALHDEAGTRLLARCIRKAYEECGTTEAQEQLYAAMVSQRASRATRTSLRRFSRAYLAGEAQERFIDACADAPINAMFEFRKDVFDRALKFRVFQLDTGVYVSSPFGEIGRSVRLKEVRASRRLDCSGEVVSDNVRTKHG